MYNPVGSPGEFVELTNLGASAIDMTGWSFDDDSRTVGSESLTGFGSINPGESVVFTEATASAFRTAWNLSSSVKVVGGVSNNLGRADEINIYNANNTLIDRLTFNDQGTGTVKGPRTQGVSARPGSAAALGANNASLWVLSSAGDVDGAYASIGNDIGSPGKTAFAAPVPLPAAAYLFIGGIGLLSGTLRRKRVR
jgi:predicted extracellular nuclease